MVLVSYICCHGTERAVTKEKPVKRGNKGVTPAFLIMAGYTTYKIIWPCNKSTSIKNT